MERWVVNNSLRVMAQRLEMRQFLRMAPLHPGATVLEVGCGRGAGGRLILKALRPKVLCLMDFDPRMVRKAQQSLSHAEKKLISCEAGDAVHLPFKNGAFDALFGFGFLHHVPNWQAAVGEISRVLKPGGIYFMEDLYPSFYQNLLTRHLLRHPRENRFESRDLKHILTESGLSLRNLREWKKVGILGVAIKQSSTVG